jgi:hypothetical protein
MQTNATTNCVSSSLLKKKIAERTKRGKKSSVQIENWRVEDSHEVVKE